MRCSEALARGHWHRIAVAIVAVPCAGSLSRGHATTSNQPNVDSANLAFDRSGCNL